jgi:hypothetical protein
MKLRSAARLGIPLALILAQSAQAAETCMTAAEAQGLVQVALPDLLTSVGEKCASTLPKSAFLQAQRKDLIARYVSEAQAAWPNARVAAMKLAGDSKFFSILPDSAAKSIITGMVSLGVGERLKQDQCPALDRAFSAMAPLPSANVAAFVVALAELQPAPAKPGRKPLFAICPPPSMARPPVTSK